MEQASPRTPIWFKKDLCLADLSGMGNGTMSEHLGMQFTEIDADYLRASLPVDHRTRQPYGLLHGGASCVLAETLGSVASALVVDPEKFMCVGLEINANHLRSAREGSITGTCTPIHIGASTHVWDIRIHDQRNKLICVSRLTVAILKKPLQ
ncbi:MAG TPA: hotdog fold thioesterase [Lacibacter sp.]|nr:hotdog fold thioesterase [Lacibacter sp.]HMO90400.1 hotdog fold thioesterase [Lacibacter sp.]HMP87544.1 hotdog fold thioesterase [Lacibacter sp.]